MNASATLMSNHGLSQEHVKEAELKGIDLNKLIDILKKFGPTALEIFLAILAMLPLKPAPESSRS